MWLRNMGIEWVMNIYEWDMIEWDMNWEYTNLRWHLGPENWGFTPIYGHFYLDGNMTNHGILG